MLRIVSIALSAALVAAVLKAQDTPARDNYSKDQQEVLDAQRAIQEATLRGDIAVLDRLWSADIMFIGGDGRVWNKAERLEDFRSRNREPSSLARPDDLSVRVYGDTAILTYSGWSEGARDGRDFNSRSYLTRVFLKRGGRWQLIHQQSALLERAR